MNIHKNHESIFISGLIRAFSEFYPNTGYGPVLMASYEPEMFDILDDGADPLQEIPIPRSTLTNYQRSNEMC